MVQRKFSFNFLIQDNKRIEPFVVNGLDTLDTLFSDTTISSVLTAVAQQTMKRLQI